MHATTFAALIAALLVSVSARAEGGSRAPLNPQFQQECGSCHVAFPPRLLDASAWHQLMTSLNKHFGNDASLDAQTRSSIESYLQHNAATRERLTPAGKPTQRITETAWFKREHDEVGAAVWQRASIKQASNCAACHSQAEQGRFNEHQIHIPR
ncbi:diheme cytochrome c [Uliginosibacterium sediminicola]|uniref:Diheme cytochrome c n=1 Tax=Uliginosibacterium sediminicola TaxID=2024550 RepID=A0ABU9YUD9_9RHOO